MYISKAMLNMRGDALGSVANPTLDLPWLPSTMSSYNVAPTQAGGTHISAEVAGAIVFSAGDAVPDTVWVNQAQAPFSLTTLRNYLIANAPTVTMDTAYASTGLIRIVNIGQGKRMFDLNSLLGRFAYAKAFTRMYIMIATNTTALAVGTATIATVLEFTPQDLIAMGAPLADNGDGTFNLTGTISLNNITFS